MAKIIKLPTVKQLRESIMMTILERQAEIESLKDEIKDLKSLKISLASKQTPSKDDLRRYYKNVFFPKPIPDAIRRELEI
jgi:hypothetical protein